MANSIITNKAGINPIPTDRYSISAGDVVKYLQDQLGFEIMADFTRWTGITPDASYVRMRVAIAATDIIVTNTSANYVERLLAANAAGLVFKKEVIDALKPYMYSENIANIRKNPEALERASKIGLYGDHLDELIRNSKFTLYENKNIYGIYLRPERIIYDMLSDPSTDKVIGNMSIIAVKGVTSEGIRWEVAVSRSASSLSHDDISIDAIFNK